MAAQGWLEEYFGYGNFCDRSTLHRREGWKLYRGLSCGLQVVSRKLGEFYRAGKIRLERQIERRRVWLELDKWDVE